MQSRQTARLTPEEEYALFSQIWQREPGAEQARAKLIEGIVSQLQSRLSRFAQIAPACADLEDWQQEAYLIVAGSIDCVPRRIENPGAYLYTTAYYALLEQLPEQQTVSLDAPLPGCDDFSLIDTIPDPGAHSPGPTQPGRIQALYEAFCRLPVHQQRALRNQYHLDFSPTGSCLKVGVKRQSTLKRSTLYSRRSAALKKLRGDPALLKVLEVRDASL